MGELFISDKDRIYLRELAKKQLGISQLPIMKERTKLWYSHNDLKGDKPLIVMETDYFNDDLLPKRVCETKDARAIETELLIHITNHELVNDDKVVPGTFSVNRQIMHRDFNMDQIIHRAIDRNGKDLGYSFEHPMVDLKSDFHKLSSSAYSYDLDATNRHIDLMQDVLGDILEIEVVNNSILWIMTFTARVVNLLGIERLMYSMIDYPEETHKLFDFMLLDTFEYMDWQERNNLLVLDNNNTRSGPGTFGFTNDLPTDEYLNTGNITTKDVWGCMNSQESVVLSPEMFEEFVFPIYKKAAERFGLIYYGCCEPVHEIWENCLSKIKNLRKVSISPWCDEEYMGEVLRKSKVIYSRKPSPNFLGLGSLDEDTFSAHIKKTLQAGRGCNMEIIFRDVYKLDGDKAKIGRAVNITRNLIEKYW